MPNGTTNEPAELPEDIQNLRAFLRGQPKHFYLECYYIEVPELFKMLIERGWITQDRVVLKSGPSRTMIEYPLRDGWRVNLDIPDEFNGDRDNRVTVIEFLGPGDPSHPHTIKVEDFSQSPAFGVKYVTAQPKKAV